MRLQRPRHRPNSLDTTSTDYNDFNVGSADADGLDAGLADDTDLEAASADATGLDAGLVDASMTLTMTLTMARAWQMRATSRRSRGHGWPRAGLEC